MKMQNGLLFSLLAAVGPIISVVQRFDFKSLENLELFKAFFYSVDTPAAIVGMDERPIMANHALQKLLGYTETELRRKTFSEITVNRFIGIDVELFHMLMAGDIPNYEIRKGWIHYRGHDVMGLLKVIPIFLNGDFVAALALVRPEEIAVKVLHEKPASVDATKDDNVFIRAMGYLKDLPNKWGWLLFGAVALFLYWLLIGGGAEILLEALKG